MSSFSSYQEWLASLPWTIPQILDACEVEARALIDAGRAYEGGRIQNAVDYGRKSGHLSAFLFRLALGRLIVACALCGKKALYRTGLEGRCSSHRFVKGEHAQRRVDRLERASAIFSEEENAKKALDHSRRFRQKYLIRKPR